MNYYPLLASALEVASRSSPATEYTTPQGRRFPESQYVTPKIILTMPSKAEMKAKKLLNISLKKPMLDLLYLVGLCFLGLEVRLYLGIVGLV